MAAASGGFDRPESSHLSRSIFDLDEEGAAELAEEVNRLLERASAIEAESIERRGSDGGKERCKKCEKGPSHGPYWYHYVRRGGRLTSRYIGKELPGQAGE